MAAISLLLIFLSPLATFSQPFLSFFTNYFLARSVGGQWRIPVYYLPTGEMALKYIRKGNQKKELKTNIVNRD